MREEVHRRFTVPGNETSSSAAHTESTWDRALAAPSSFIEFERDTTVPLRLHWPATPDAVEAIADTLARLSEDRIEIDPAILTPLAEAVRAGKSLPTHAVTKLLKLPYLAYVHHMQSPVAQPYGSIPHSLRVGIAGLPLFITMLSRSPDDSWIGFDVLRAAPPMPAEDSSHDLLLEVGADGKWPGAADRPETPRETAIDPHLITEGLWHVKLDSLWDLSDRIFRLQGLKRPEGTFAVRSATDFEKEDLAIDDSSGLRFTWHGKDARIVLEPRPEFLDRWPDDSLEGPFYSDNQAISRLVGPASNQPLDRRIARLVKFFESRGYCAPAVFDRGDSVPLNDFVRNVAQRQAEIIRTGGLFSIHPYHNALLVAGPHSTPKTLRGDLIDLLIDVHPDLACRRLYAPERVVQLADDPAEIWKTLGAFGVHLHTPDRRLVELLEGKARPNSHMLKALAPECPVSLSTSFVLKKKELQRTVSLVAGLEDGPAACRVELSAKVNRRTGAVRYIADINPVEWEPESEDHMWRLLDRCCAAHSVRAVADNMGDLPFKKEGPRNHILDDFQIVNPRSPCLGVSFGLREFREG